MGKNKSKDNKTTIDGIINDALKNLKEIIDVNTVIGESFHAPDGTVIIPISKIVVGFVGGGGEFDSGYHKKPENFPFAGGSGAGFTVVPIGFLTGKGGDYTFISTKSDTKYDELINITNKTLKLILDNFTAKK